MPGSQTLIASTPHNHLGWLCGDEGTRTPDIRLAKAALSQLSYIPSFAAGKVVGLTGFEPVTPVLSGLCSNQLSYRPSQMDP